MSPSKLLAPKRNISARIHDGPSSSLINASHSMDCLAVRMPPAGLKPTAIPVCCAYSRMARVITNPTGKVAFVGSLPVEVLMKPASAENMRSGDDYVDLMSARLHRSANFRHPLRQRR